MGKKLKPNKSINNPKKSGGDSALDAIKDKLPKGMTLDDIPGMDGIKPLQILLMNQDTEGEVTIKDIKGKEYTVSLRLPVSSYSSTSSLLACTGFTVYTLQ